MTTIRTFHSHHRRVGTELTPHPSSHPNRALCVYGCSYDELGCILRHLSSFCPKSHSGAPSGKWQFDKATQHCVGVSHLEKTPGKVPRNHGRNWSGRWLLRFDILNAYNENDRYIECPKMGTTYRRKAVFHITRKDKISDPIRGKLIYISNNQDKFNFLTSHALITPPAMASWAFPAQMGFFLHNKSKSQIILKLIN